MLTTKDFINKTKEYLSYIERHYDNVQKAFAEFSKRTLAKNFQEKYSKFLYQTKLYDDFIWHKLSSNIAIHDMSKLGNNEFIQYRQHFYPVFEEEKQNSSFAKAWEHHQKHNFHHWQSRENKTFSGLSGFEGALYAIENALDWIAMAYEFNEKPLNKYYLENKNKIKLSKEDKYIIETVYEIMMDESLVDKEKDND